MKPYEPEKLFKAYYIMYHVRWNNDLPELSQKLYVEACNATKALEKANDRLRRFFGHDGYVIDGWELKENEPKQ